MIITYENDVPLNALIRQVEELTIFKPQLKEEQNREEAERYYNQFIKPQTIK